MRRGYLDALEAALETALRGKPSGQLRWLWTASRAFPSEWDTVIHAQLNLALTYLPAQGIQIVHGDAVGGDRHVHLIALGHGLPKPWRFPVSKREWDLYGGYAGHQRNARMIETSQPDIVSALIHNHSRGTTGCRDNALARGIPTVTVDDEIALLPRVRASL